MDAAKPPRSLVAPDQIRALLRMAIQAPAAGAFAELGVYKGGTAWWLWQVAERQGRALWLFDTFTGIPFSDPVDWHQVGDFGDTSEATVRALLPKATIVAGVFPDSVRGVELPPLAFVHVDADQYRSVRAACEVFGPKMVHGGVMWFDDYSWPTTPGARKAIDECFGGRVERSGRGPAFVRFP